MKKLPLLLLTMSLFVLCGCGYSFTSLTHPQLESVAVAPVTNETLSYNASAVLRQKLTELFTVDGSMKLKTVQSADCIVYARILKVNFRELGISSTNDDDDFLPEEWKVTVSVEFSVVIPGRAKPLIGPKTVTGTAEFVNGNDLETARLNGVKQALFSAAGTIVSNLTEAW